jgi:hypothetical protein
MHDGEHGQSEPARTSALPWMDAALDRILFSIFQFFLCLKGVYTQRLALKSHFSCFEIPKYIRETCFVVIVVNINSCNL